MEFAQQEPDGRDGRLDLGRLVLTDVPEVWHFPDGHAHACACRRSDGNGERRL